SVESSSRRDTATNHRDGRATQIQTDIAFRVIADHIRTLSFAIADGIIPSNEGRGYVLRRILRRAVRYGRTLEFREPFLYKLVDIVAQIMGDVFPEVREKAKRITETIRHEEEAFNKTLDRGIELFEEVVTEFEKLQITGFGPSDESGAVIRRGKSAVGWTVQPSGKAQGFLTGPFAFRLYDEQGFPLDLTELMARERGLTVDVLEFERLMDEQRERARKAQKKEAITVTDENLKVVKPTKFLGYDFFETEAVVENVLPGTKPQELNVILDRTSCYAEMGGQVGDRGLLHVPGHDWTEVGQLRVIDTQKHGDVFLHRAALVKGRAPEPGEAVRISVDADRRKLIQGHHTVTH